MNKWYETYTLLIDQYNAVLMSHNTGEINRSEELARLRQIKALHLDLWFETHGRSVRERLDVPESEFQIVALPDGTYAHRWAERLCMVKPRPAQSVAFNYVHLVNWSRSMVPVYLPGRELQI